MTVSTFTQPDNTSQDPSTYKAALDHAAAVMKRIGVAFAPHESSPQAMTVTVDAGAVYALPTQTLTEVAEQTTAVIVAPTTNPRIDRVVIDQKTGVVSVVAGAEAPAPTAPAIPAGKLPCARVNLVVSQSVIVNADITDERDLRWLGGIFLAANSGLVLDGNGLGLDLAVLAALTAPATGDQLAIDDVSQAAPKRRRITLADMLKVINGLTEDVSPDTANDFVASYDGSAGAAKKIKLSTLGGAGRLLSIQVFTNSATYTRPANVNAALVIAKGPGGGGGGADALSGNAAAGGGGEGETAIKLILSGLGSTETVTIGAGGGGGSSIGGGGGAGGNTSFGAHVSANGGRGGAGLGPNTNGRANGGEGGSGGTGGDLYIRGAPGFNAASNFVSGSGGGSGGGRGRGGNPGAGRAGADGGGGGGASSDVFTVAGGAGGAGWCIVLEFS